MIELLFRNYCCVYIVPLFFSSHIPSFSSPFSSFLLPFSPLQLGFTNKAVVSDVWCTSSQFLRLGHGDWEEHAILLANFYLWWDEQNIQQYNVR